MSLRLLVDEDSQSRALVSLLREWGHEVITVSEAGLLGARDTLIFEFAVRKNCVILTHNCSDFRRLHNTNSDHQGIICTYEYNQASKNMTYAQVVQAIANLEDSGCTIAGEFVALNAWNFQTPDTQA
jgi:predicted nuclease of predicted toxin-antitoxin system